MIDSLWSALQRRACAYAVFQLATLAAAAITVKLSAAVLATTALLVGLAAWVVRAKKPGISRSMLPALCVPAAIGLGPWVLRNVVLSGAPFFPNSALTVRVPWAMPPENIREAYQAIIGWARSPGPDYLTTVDSWRWIGPWAQRVFRNSVLDLTIPLALAVVTGLFALWRQSRRRTASSRLPWLFFLPPVASTGYWFLTAPDVRFLGACLVVLSPGFMAMILGLTDRSRRSAVVNAGLALTVVLCVIDFHDAGWARAGDDAGFHRVPRYHVRPFHTRSALIVQVPTVSDQCWDAPLPCAPYPSPYLRLLRTGDPCGGFALEGPSRR